ncbi:MAG: hypothetical protein MJ230_00480 [bacterium]|nr:hypothetical protein [bacterium]
MGKSKSRSLNRHTNDKFKYLTREGALEAVIKNIDDTDFVIDTVTLFDFTAEDILEAGADYEDVVALGGIVK